MIQDPLALAGLITGVTALGFWLEGRFQWARRAGASLLIIFFGALLSNLDLVPASSSVYGIITGPVTSLAIVWLLLAVDLRDVLAAGPRLPLAFGLAVVSTSVGALTAILSFGGAFPEEGWKLAGVVTGTYSGGGLNFVAVGREVGLSESMFAAATAADNVVTALWIGATLMLPIWLKRFYPPRPEVTPPAETSSDGEATDRPANPFLAEVLLQPVHLLTLLTLGFGFLLTANLVSEHVGGPSILWLTSLALAAGQLPAIRSLKGSLQLGLIALNLFFVVIGIASRIAEILRVGPEVFYFMVVTIAIHGILVYGGGRLLKLDVETLSVASQAAVGGPSTAMALSVFRDWKDLALPGTLVGLLGYAVGNYAGLMIAAWVRTWGG